MHRVQFKKRLTLNLRIKSAVRNDLTALFTLTTSIFLTVE